LDADAPFITNRSSGLMGHALALAARDRGASVTLISSAHQMPSPCGVDRVGFHDVESLRNAVLMASAGADLVMAAAVSDYRPKTVSTQKIKKSDESLTLELGTVPNFIPEVPPGVLRVGFAAETDPDLAKAAVKLASRSFDMLCLNDVPRLDAGCEVDTNALYPGRDWRAHSDAVAAKDRDRAHRDGAHRRTAISTSKQEAVKLSLDPTRL
jgi:phosphopantothenoylcysteine decarboxylase/phosphopantothenate--cysteine ligase